MPFRRLVLSPAHDWYLVQCQDEVSGRPLQDTFKTSLCTNQLFPTVDCPVKASPIPPCSPQRTSRSCSCSCAVGGGYGALFCHRFPTVDCPVRGSPNTSLFDAEDQSLWPLCSRKRVRVVASRTVGCREQPSSAHGCLERVLEATTRTRPSVRHKVSRG